MDATLPLLDDAELPRFDQFRPAMISGALDELLAQAERALRRACDPATADDYDALASALDPALERLERVWGWVGHLHAVTDSPELREAYTANLARVTDFFTRLGSDAALSEKYRRAQVGAAAPVPAGRGRALRCTVRNFQLSGALLQGAARERFAQIQERLAQLTQAYSEHVLDATDQFAHWVDLPPAVQPSPAETTRPPELAGVPDDVLEGARQQAQADGRQGYKLTLQAPCYWPVMQYAEHRPLRETLYRAYVTRASELGPAELDNSAAMGEILQLRAEEARLLEFGNYAELSLATKMARNPREVLDFLDDLARRARPYALRDLQELRDFSREHLGLDDLQPWDVAYASEKLRQARYAYSEQEVKQYFTSPAVVAGWFALIERLFDLRIHQIDAPVWHDSVRVYAVEHAGRVLGRFYVDAFARARKQSGAHVQTLVQRYAVADRAEQTPSAALVMNWPNPVKGETSLLTHDDVITFAHEFGHVLQSLLARQHDLRLSGISNVEWDAVELPSQFMENFCWEWDVVQTMTAHVDQGHPLPRPLYDKMLAAKNFQSGLQTLRQIEYSVFDMRLHCEADSPRRLQAIADEVRARYGVMPAAPFNRFAHSFSHIFSGGYAAGYYSYKWAEVLSADAYGAFEEAAVGGGNVLDPATGRRYREAILEAGASRDAMDNFKAFRGREPSLEALLRHQGMATPGVR